MAIRFGAITDTLLLNNLAFGGPGGVPFAAAGWYCPDAYDAAKAVVRLANASIRLDATDGELEMRWTAATTSKQASTTGANVTPGVWNFFGFLGLANSSNDDPDTVIWAAPWPNAPVRITPTQTQAMVGNPSASASEFHPMNFGGSSIAVIGDAEHYIMWTATQAGSGTNPSVFNGTSSTALGDDCIEFVERHLILPYWLGDKCPTLVRDHRDGKGPSVQELPLWQERARAGARVNVRAVGELPTANMTGTTTVASNLRASRPYTDSIFLPRVRR